MSYESTSHGFLSNPRSLIHSWSRVVHWRDRGVDLVHAESVAAPGVDVQLGGDPGLAECREAGDGALGADAVVGRD